MLDLLLLLSVVAAVLTGFIVDRLDLHQFRLHAQAGYAMAALVVVHLVMHWRPVTQFRAARRRRPASAPRPRQKSGGTATSAPAGPEADTPASDPQSRPELEPTSARVASGKVGASPGQGEPSAATMARARRASQRRPTGVGRRRQTRRSVLAATAAGVGGAAAGWYGRTLVTPTPYEGGDVGVFYHQQSSTGVRAMLRSLLDWGSRPAQYKKVERGPAVALPSDVEVPTTSVADALAQRRSLRSYEDRPLTTEELAWLVYAATGITSSGGRRTAPSAGALYPVETYVGVRDVAGVEPGLYHVGVREQALEPVREGSVSGDLALAGLGQDLLGAAPVVFVLTGSFQRSRWKYHERHYRYVAWEAGHIAQNLCLAAEAADLGACVVGSFLDQTLNDLLRIDGREEAALGLIAVGAR